MRCFKEVRSKESVLAKIKQAIAEAEALAERLGVIGAQRLQNQALDKDYRPEKQPREKTPFVDCPDHEVRQHCIEKYRYFRAKCRQAWEQVKEGVEAVWPSGAFVPSRRWVPLVQPQAG